MLRKRQWRLGACVSSIQGSSLKQHASGIPNAEDVLRTQIGSEINQYRPTLRKKSQGRQSDMCHLKVFLLSKPRNENVFPFANARSISTYSKGN